MGHACGREATDGDCAIKFVSNENDFALRVAIAFRSCGLTIIASSSIDPLLITLRGYSIFPMPQRRFKEPASQTLRCPCCLSCRKLKPHSAVNPELSAGRGLLSPPTISAVLHHKVIENLFDFFAVKSDI